ncbi:MAG: Pr6Pr family membrane protein [Methyloceanibacter sp.]
MGAAALGWFAIVLQYTLTVRYKTDGDLVTAAIRFSSYFTDLSNVLVALAMTLPWLAPDTSLGRFFTRPSVRTAILAYTSSSR